jgi:hypothetical protein
MVLVSASQADTVIRRGRKTVKSTRRLFNHSRMGIMHICESLVMCHTGGGLNRNHLGRELGRLDLHVDRLCSGQLIESCSHTQPYTSASHSRLKAAQNATRVLTESRQADPTSTVLDTRPTQGRVRSIGPVQKDGTRFQLAREHVERVGGFLVLDVGPHRGGLRAFITGSATI